MNYNNFTVGVIRNFFVRSAKKTASFDEKNLNRLFKKKL